MRILAGGSPMKESEVELHLVPDGGGYGVYLKACPNGRLGRSEEVILMHFTGSGVVETSRHAEGINDDAGSCWKFDGAGRIIVSYE